MRSARLSTGSTSGGTPGSVGSIVWATFSSRPSLPPKPRKRPRESDLEPDPKELTHGVTEKRNVVHNTFCIERNYDAAPERVFQAFANLEHKTQWSAVRASG